MNILKQTLGSFFNHDQYRKFTDNDIHALLSPTGATGGVQGNSKGTSENDINFQRYLKADEYTLRHIVEHLCQSEQYENLFHLLLRNSAWAEAKFVRMNSDASYLQDLDTTIASLPNPQDEFQQLITILLHAAKHGVHSRLITYNDSRLKTLVMLGHKSEALGYARLRLDPQAQFEGLLAIYTVLRESGFLDISILEEMHALVRDTRDPGKQSLQLELIHVLLDVPRFDIAIDLALGLAAEPERSVVLKEIVIALANSMNIDLAFQVCDQIAGKAEQVKALCGIVRALAQRGDNQQTSVIDQMIDFFGLVPEDQTKVDTAIQIATLFRNMDDVRAQAFFDHALGIARALKHSGDRLKSLASVTMAMARHQLEVPSVLRNEMIQGLNGITNEMNMRRQTGFKTHDFGIWAARICNPVLEAFIEIRDPRVHQIAKSISSFFPPGAESHVLVEQFMQSLVKGGLFTTALRLARAERDPFLYSNARLVNLAKCLLALDHNYDPRMIKPLEAAIRWLRNNGNPGKAKALAYLAIVFSRKEAPRGVMVAREAVNVVLKGNWSYGIQVDVALILAQGGYFDEVFMLLSKLSRTLGGTDELKAAAEVLAVTAERMAGVKDERAPATLKKSLELVQWVMSNFSRDHTLETMSEKMAQSRHVPELLITALFIRDPEKQTHALSQAALTLFDMNDSRYAAVLVEASNRARTVSNPIGRPKALCNVAVAMAKCQDPQAKGVFAEVIEHASKAGEFGSYALDEVVSSMAEIGWTKEALEVLVMLAAHQTEGANRSSDDLLFRSLGTALDSSRIQGATTALVKAFIQSNDINSAVQLVDSVKEPEIRTGPLLMLVRALAHKGRWLDVEHMLLQIDEPLSRELARREIVASLREALPLAGMANVAMNDVSTLQDISLRMQILALFVESKLVSDPGVMEILWNSASALRTGSDGVVDALCAAIRAIPAAQALKLTALIDRTLQEVEMLEEPPRRVLAWFRIAQTFLQIQNPRAASIVEKAWNELNKSRDIAGWSAAFADVAQLLTTRELFTKILAVMDEFAEESERETLLHLSLRATAKAKCHEESSEVLSRMHQPLYEDYFLAGEALIANDQLKAALSLLNRCDLTLFMATVTGWGNILAQSQPGIEIKIVREIIRIASWFVPYWQDIHSVLSENPASVQAAVFENNIFKS